MLNTAFAQAGNLVASQHTGQRELLIRYILAVNAAMIYGGEKQILYS